MIFENNIIFHLDTPVVSQCLQCAEQLACLFILPWHEIYSALWWLIICVNLAGSQCPSVTKHYSTWFCEVFWDKNNIQISEFWIRLPSSKHLGLIASAEGLNILKHLSFLNKRESCGRLLSDLKVKNWLFLCLQPDGWTWSITSILSWISTLQNLYLLASIINERGEWKNWLKAQHSEN